MGYYKTSTANIIEGNIAVSSPKYIKSDLLSICEKWVAKQDRFWPTEVTSEVLSGNLELVYIPHWVYSGSGSAHWSAQVGQDHSIIKLCPTCNGRGSHYDNSECFTCSGSGRIQETETRWSSQSGIITSNINNRVQENISNEFKVKCGGRVTSSPQIWVDRVEINKYIILTPKNSSMIAGKTIAERSLNQDLRNEAERSASRMGRVRDLQIGYVQISTLDVYTWLYPIYTGFYDYKDERLPIQIDSISGKVWIDAPREVKAKRFKRNIKVAVMIAALLGCIFLGVSLSGQVVDKIKNIEFSSSSEKKSEVVSSQKPLLSGNRSATPISLQTQDNTGAGLAEAFLNKSGTSTSAWQTAEAFLNKSGTSTPARQTVETHLDRPGTSTPARQTSDSVVFCIVTASQNANKRSDPSLNFPREGVLKAGDTAKAIGQYEAEDLWVWWLLEDKLWVREDVVNEERDCKELPRVNP